MPWIARTTRIARPASLPLPRLLIPLLCSLSLLLMLVPLPGSDILVAPALAVLGVARSMRCIRLAALGAVLQAAGVAAIFLLHTSLLVGILAVAGSPVAA
jgi:hypothetical protein